MTNTTKCPHCGEARERMTVQIGHKEYTAGFKPCQCKAARHERQEAERAEQERIRKEEAERLTRKLESAGIPKRYLEARHDSAQAMAEAVKEGVGFYIDGDQGTGKTHLACAIARQLIEQGVAVKFVVASELMEAIRSRKAEDRSITATISNARVLVLDDLGKETPTAYACERLFDIINERYNDMLPIIVTSNYSRGKIAQKLTEGDVGKSVASRLTEMTRRIPLNGEDRRLARG